MTDPRLGINVPPLHNLLVCAGPECVPQCPVYQWHELRGMEPTRVP